MLIFYIAHQALRDFQNATPGTKTYLLSLIELVARACHQIAVLLFQLDEGVHKRSVYEAWRDAPVISEQWESSPRLPSAFVHRGYRFHEQYPYGIADVAGYWAEAKIFGGVVVFDRGPSATEVSSIHIQSSPKAQSIAVCLHVCLLLCILPASGDRCFSMQVYLVAHQHYSLQPPTSSKR